MDSSYSKEIIRLPIIILPFLTFLGYLLGFENMLLNRTLDFQLWDTYYVLTPFMIWYPAILLLTFVLYLFRYLIMKEKTAGILFLLVCINSLLLFWLVNPAIIIEAITVSVRKSGARGRPDLIDFWSFVLRCFQFMLIISLIVFSIKWNKAGNRSQPY
jgi:hypothetical protein